MQPLRLAAGVLDGATGETFDAGTLATRGVGEQGVLALGTPAVLEASNIERPDF